MEFWFILGLCLIVLEGLLGFTIITFIAGIAAINIGVLCYFFPEYYPQPVTVFSVAMYCGSIGVWTLLLYKPLKALKNRSKGTYSNIVGQEGEVIDKPLKPGKIGKIKWSGTFVKAKLTHGAKHQVPVGENVKIIDIKDNVFIVVKE
jgi:membrane-bound ClpP family serine protease